MKVLFEKKFHHSLGEITFQVFEDRPDFPFSEVKQVHGPEIVTASSEIVEADGILNLFESYKDLPMAIKTADCLPVAMIGKKGMAMIHAGWRGVHQEILISPKLQSLEIESIFIGPSICAASYEVGPEFLDHFPQYPDCFKKKGEKYLFDLPKTALLQMEKHYPNAQIELSEVDTFTTPGHNSYRKDKTTRRNYNVLNIKFSKP